MDERSASARHGAEPDLRSLKDRAAALLAKGRYAEAVQAFEAVVRAAPLDISARQRVADARRKAGDARGALAAYREVAERYAAMGMLVKAIAICKVILEIDETHHATQVMLANLYAKRGVRAGIREPCARSAGASPPPGRVERGTRPRPADLETRGRPAGEDSEDGAVPTPYERIVRVAREAVEAGADDELAPEIEIEVGDPEPGPAPAPGEGAGEGTELADPPRWFSTPLFSDLSPGAFLELARRLSLRRIARGDTVIRQGDVGTSLFVVASGRVRVERKGKEGRSVLARLGEGEFFGEMAMLSGAPRIASVVAEDEGELLEISAELLADLSRSYPHVADSLTKFYQERLVANVMGTSALFQPYSPVDREALMRRFETRDVGAGEAVVREGHPSDGLYVVLSGELEVFRGGRSVARLVEGDLFGEMSCLGKGPASATVSTRRRARLLWLRRAVFDEVVSSHPPTLELVAQLGEQRRRDLEAMPKDRARGWRLLV
jgi:CRP-like cAMP-binding protein